MQTIQQTIDSTPVRMFATERPEYLLIQPSARHELKNDGLNREAELIAQASTRGFVLAAFDTCQWARALMPCTTMPCLPTARWGCMHATRFALCCTGCCPGWSIATAVCRALLAAIP